MRIGRLGDSVPALDGPPVVPDQVNGHTGTDGPADSRDIGGELIQARTRPAPRAPRTHRPHARRT